MDTMDPPQACSATAHEPETPVAAPICVLDQLAAIRARASAHAVVDRLIPVTIDLDHLAVADYNDFDHQVPSADAGAYDERFERAIGLQARGNIQILLNSLYALERKQSEEALLAMYPSNIDDATAAATARTNGLMLPREKSLPKPKPLTRWEKFAKEKGILKKKKTRMVFDEESKEYRPRWGFKSINNEKVKQWAIPIKNSPNTDPEIDPRAQLRAEKKARVAANTGRMKRNQGVPKAGAAETASPISAAPAQPVVNAERRKDMLRTLTLSKRATASAGKFDPEIKGDVKATRGKRKFSALVGDLASERDAARAMATRILKGAPVVNAERAANIMQREREYSTRMAKNRRLAGERDELDDADDGATSGARAGRSGGKGKRQPTSKRSKQGMPLAARTKTTYSKAAAAAANKRNAAAAVKGKKGGKGASKSRR